MRVERKFTVAILSIPRWVQEPEMSFLKNYQHFPLRNMKVVNGIYPNKIFKEDMQQCYN